MQINHQSLINQSFSSCWFRVWAWRRPSSTRRPPSDRSAWCALWPPWPRTGDTRSCVERDTEPLQLGSSASGIHTPTRTLRCAYRNGRVCAPALASPSCSVLAWNWPRLWRQRLGALTWTPTRSRDPSDPKGSEERFSLVQPALWPFDALKATPGPRTPQGIWTANFWGAPVGTRRRRFAESPSFCPTTPGSPSRAGNVLWPTPYSATGDGRPLE